VPPRLDSEREHALEGGKLLLDAGVRGTGFLPVHDVGVDSVRCDVEGPAPAEEHAEVREGGREPLGGRPVVHAVVGFDHSCEIIEGKALFVRPDELARPHLGHASPEQLDGIRSSRGA
jgi:hypothetical protein